MGTMNKAVFTFLIIAVVICVNISLISKPFFLIYQFPKTGHFRERCETKAQARKTAAEGKSQW